MDPTLRHPPPPSMVGRIRGILLGSTVIAMVSLVLHTMPAKNHPKSLETARAPARNRVGGHHSKFRVMQRYIGAFSPSSLLPRVHSSSPRRETGRGGGRLGVFAEGLDSTSNTQFSDNTEKWVYEDDQIEAGSILLWEPPSSEQGQDQGTKTEGDYFKHTAVLLVEHSDTVTTGFVLNQPSMHTVEEAVAINTLPAIFKESPVFVGGPIGSSLEIIHRIPNVKNSTTIADGIYYGGDINHAASLIQKGEADLESVRFMYRFAGWYPGQLSEEIAAGCWRVVKASPSWIFDKLPRHLVTPLARPEVWARMMSKVGDERVSRDEVASLTNPKTVDMWVSALTKPNPEAGACVIAAIAKYSENLSSKRGSDNGSGDDEEGEEEGRSEDSEKDGNASLLSQEEVLQEVEEDVERRLDAIQREVMWTLAASRSDPSAGIPGIEARLSALNGVLYNGLKMGLPMNEKTAAEAMGASMVLYQSEHYFIDHALESLAADPFLLSVIYMALGRRVGVDLLPVYLTQLPTRILLRTEGEQNGAFFVDAARNGTAFEEESVLRDLHSGVRAAAEMEAKFNPAAAADAGWFPEGESAAGPLTLPGIEGESDVAPLARVYGQMLMALANACVIRGKNDKGESWKRVARGLQEAVDILEMDDLGLSS